jgi:hypothetical protein
MIGIGLSIWISGRSFLLIRQLNDALLASLNVDFDAVHDQPS